MSLFQLRFMMTCLGVFGISRSVYLQQERRCQAFSELQYAGISAYACSSQNNQDSSGCLLVLLFMALSSIRSFDDRFLAAVANVLSNP